MFCIKKIGLVYTCVSHQKLANSQFSISKSQVLNSFNWENIILAASILLLTFLTTLIFKAPYSLLFDVQNGIVHFVTTFTQEYARTKFFFQNFDNHRLFWLFYTILGHIHLFVATSSSKCRCRCGWGFWSFGLISWKK